MCFVLDDAHARSCGTQVSKVIPALERRLFKHLKADQVEAAFRRIIKKTAGHWGSRWYDYFQNLQQGIAI